MNLQAITGAIIDLQRAFDFAEAPGGETFWKGVIYKLNFHHKYVREAGRLAQLAAPQAMPDLTMTTKLKSANRLFCLSAASALSLGFAWANTREGNAYWLAISNFLAMGATHDKRDTAGSIYTANEGPIGYLAEVNELNTMGWRRPDFTDELWYIPGQWPHHNPEDPTLIKYLPKGKSPQLKNFTVAKPGKFLTSHYNSVLTEPEIADFAAKFRAKGEPPKLLFAETADEIARVYRLGPSSCMAGGKNVDGIEPVRAYESPDLKLAYFERDGKPTARCLVRPSNFAYSRIYGDSAVLLPALHAAKFIHNARSETDKKAATLFHGVRLTALIAKDRRPAHAFYEAANEPVCITPFFDLSAAAYYSHKTGYLHVEKCDNDKYRKGYPAPHFLRGGYSIPAIPAKGAFQLHPNDRNHFLVHVGASGNNGAAYLTLTECDRDPTDHGIIEKKIEEERRQMAAYANAFQNAVQANQQTATQAPVGIRFAPRGFGF